MTLLTSHHRGAGDGNLFFSWPGFLEYLADHMLAATGGMPVSTRTKLIQLLEQFETT
jgi:hypothetical protein